MTWETLNKKIQELIIKRRTATEEEQEKINALLTKLYDCRIVMLEQANRNGQKLVMKDFTK